MPLELEIAVVIAYLIACIVYPKQHQWYDRNERIRNFAVKFLSLYSALNGQHIIMCFPNVSTSQKRRTDCSKEQLDSIIPLIDEIAQGINALSVESIFNTFSILGNCTDLKDRLVPIILYPTLPPNKKCTLHNSVLKNTNLFRSRPYALRVVHTMKGGVIGIVARYSCSIAGKNKCVYECGKHFENGFAHWDCDQIRDEQFEYFLSSGRSVFSKDLVRDILAQWMHGVPFSKMADIYNERNYPKHTKRENDWNLAGHKIGDNTISLNLNAQRLREMFYLYTLAKVCSINLSYTKSKTLA